MLELLIIKGGNFTDRFSKFNPFVTFLFFILCIASTLIWFEPLFLAAGLLASVLYKIKLEGKKGISYFFKIPLPLTVLTALFNMLFAHYGMTVLFTITQTQFTLESLFYGMCQGIMFSAVITWFSCYSQVVTSERFMAVMGRFAPNCALVLSMALSFIPRLKKNAAEINDARMLLDSGSNRLSKSVKNFSALLTLTLEESIDTADSMKSRGFCGGRKAYSKYSFSFRDGICIVFTAAMFLALCVFKALGVSEFLFDPVIKVQNFSIAPLLVYCVFSFLPLIVDFTEDMRWLLLKQKI